MVHLDTSGGGGEGNGFQLVDNNFFEAVAGTTPLLATTGTLSRLMHVGVNGGDRLDDDATGSRFLLGTSWLAIAPGTATRFNPFAGTD